MAKINLLVLDLSHHNKVTSFKKIYDSGIRGVILKSSQGTRFVDKTYRERKKQAVDNGLLVGAYHFADASDPVRQVNHFLDIAKPDANTLMALDYEPYGNNTMSIQNARVFLEKLDADLKRINVLYSGNLIKETLSKDPDGFWKKHPLWLAHYSKTYRLPKQWDRLFLWQFSDGNVNTQGTKVDGVTGDVDRNSYEGNDLAKEWVISTEVKKKVEQPIIINTPKVVVPEPPEPVAAPVPWWKRLFRF